MRGGGGTERKKRSVLSWWCIVQVFFQHSPLSVLGKFDSIMGNVFSSLDTGGGVKFLEGEAAAR